MTVVVTGAAGFIGNALAQRLLDDGHDVVGVDCFTPYYDVALKEARVRRLDGREQWRFERLDLADPVAFVDLCRTLRPDRIVHLAAQPGVRAARDDPHAYTRDNLVAFTTVLEAARHAQVDHLVYASSSSIYGESKRLPFRVDDPAVRPVSLYAATKRANELMAHTYTHLYDVACTGLRFFSVYGPWGRPDMAYFSFAEAILDGRPITVFGDGTATRDLTYVDDIVEGVARVAALEPAGDERWRVFNIGHGERVTVQQMIELLEQHLGGRAIVERADPSPDDVPTTWADTSDLEAAIGFTPGWRVDDGLAEFASWLRWWRGRRS